MKCDFCYVDVEFPWIYDTKEFDTHWEHKGKHLNVDAEEGAWSACDDCSPLIEDEDLKGLSVRAAKILCKEGGKPPGFEQLLQEKLLQLYVDFMRSRKGKRHK